MKAGQAAYNQAETSADRAAKALEKIGIAADAQIGKLQAAVEIGDTAAIDAAVAKIAQLTARQGEAAAKAASTAAAMNVEAAALDRLKSAAASAAISKDFKTAESAAKAAAKATEKAGDAAEGASINFRALSSGLGKLGGPLGSIGSTAAGVGGAFQKLSKALGAAGPYVAAAVLAAVLATAFAAATLAITHFAVSAADTARTQALLSDGIAGSVEGGRALDKTFADLSNKVPLAREELVSMASELAKTGLKGDALSEALETAAVKAATLKFGPNFAKQMLSLDNQAAKLKAGVTGLFSGLKIESLLEGLAKLVGLFDASEASGKAIKVVFESLFQPIIDGLTALIPKAVSTFLQLEILAMKALIAIKPWGTELTYLAYAFGIITAVIVAAVGIVIAILLALVALPVALVAGFMWLSDASVALGASIRSGVGAGLDWLSAKFDEVIAFLSGLSLTEIGTNMINGLVDGIMSAGPKILSAISGLANGAIDAAKKALGIASPSKVFAEIGVHTAAGMAQGVDGEAGAVQGSLESMVAPPDAAAPAAAPSSSPGKGGLSGAVFNFYGVEGAQDAQDRFLSMLEGFQAQAGSAAPNAA
jgi:hypothetical protein